MSGLVGARRAGGCSGWGETRPWQALGTEMHRGTAGSWGAAVGGGSLCTQCHWAGSGWRAVPGPLTWGRGGWVVVLSLSQPGHRCRSSWGGTGEGVARDGWQCPGGWRSAAAALPPGALVHPSAAGWRGQARPQSACLPQGLCVPAERGGAGLGRLPDPAGPPLWGGWCRAALAAGWRQRAREHTRAGRGRERAVAQAGARAQVWVWARAHACGRARARAGGCVPMRWIVRTHVGARARVPESVRMYVVTETVRAQSPADVHVCAGMFADVREHTPAQMPAHPQEHAGVWPCQGIREHARQRA